MASAGYTVLAIHLLLLAWNGLQYGQTWKLEAHVFKFGSYYSEINPKILPFVTMESALYII